MSTQAAPHEAATATAISQLVAQAKAGNQTAFAALIVMHQPMAHAIAKRWSESLVPRDEAVSECRLAFVSSFTRYDPTRLPLTAYWAAKAQNAVVDYYRKNLRVGRDNGKMAAAYVEELKESGSVDVADFAKRHSLSHDRAIRIAAWAPPTKSIEGERESGETFERATSEEPGPDEAVVKESDSQAIAQLARELPKNQWRAIAGYYGLDGAPPRTLTEIGRDLGVTPQRVQQIMKDAFARLRKNPVVTRELAPA